MNINTIELDFNIEPQKESRLCWAAVSIAIAKFYKVNNVSSQIDFAKFVAGKQYNQFCNPEKALTFYGNLNKKWDRPLNKREILNELINQRPITACMKYFVGWHLVVIYGIDPNNELMIADPLMGNSSYSLQLFTHGYNKHYHWEFTFTTQMSTSETDL
ncbi:papain-like cysteine protease family protein [Membranihabitans maritimus]|uniref:papain-like cysteine protease family protein n=1 Tax=Membranihabitans maritimus TaxID=2904244 RepID=UPI001F2D6ABC|nr:papain-like cysteine protease family protein [Membranihabitans maritimus]